MKAKDMTNEQMHTVITHDSWLTGPRWAFGPLWLDRQIATVNNELVSKGWDPIKIVSQRTEKTLLQKGITFTIRGQAYCLAFFLEGIARAVDN